MSKLDKDTVIAQFTAAYQKANGKAPSIEAKGGWYSVDGEKNIRLAQLEELTATLDADTTSPKASVTSATKSKKETAKPANKTKKSAAKKSDFSVKDFYKQQILDANPGSTVPR